jgi:hypothetical protein
MNTRLKKLAVPGLRVVVGLIVALQSAIFAFSAASAQAVARIGLPQWIRPALGGTELVAAILFLIPTTILVGGYALLFIFVIAVAIHFLHGQFDVSALAVYTMAVIVCLTHREAPPER